MKMKLVMKKKRRKNHKENKRKKNVQVLMIVDLRVHRVLKLKNKKRFNFLMNVIEKEKR